MKETYDWVPWFRELVRRIENEGEAYLNENARQVDWGENLAQLEYGDEGIDPFSFLYFLASKAGTSQLKTVYDSVGQKFGIESPLPDPSEDEHYIFPTPPGLKVLFRDGENFHNALLWRLFRQAVPVDPEIEPNVFRDVLDIKNVATPKLTQSLFLINPEYFLPVDDSYDALSKTRGFSSLAELQTEISENGGYGKYQSFLGKIKEAFPGCQPYEINMFLYLQNSVKIHVSGDFYHISTHAYNPSRGDYWEDREDSFKENNWVFTGGPGSGKPWDEEGDYPLVEPNRGDIVLVRTGLRRGRAIGVVQKNDYAELGKNKDSRIHVLWINKTEDELATDTRQNAFEKVARDWKTYEAFKEADAYKPTLDLIERLTGNQVKEQPETDPDMQQPESTKMKNEYPLNQILYGPPGTGKTWNTVDYALAIIEDEPLDVITEEDREDKLKRFDELKENRQIQMVTFHQNYNYEDFIEGIRPVLGDDANGKVEYELVPGVFRTIAKSATNDRKQNYVLIIDEINRGNIAKIFGELITLIEESKRIGGVDAATATLPYSKDEFGVPNNLYIIGTMNTADRSIALLDTALRRRFDFVEMMPDPELVSDDVDGVNSKELLVAMNKRIRVLLDREHQIGHTYFMDVDNLESLEAAFKNRIIPLLQEYFYDEWENIDLVFNRNGFIRKSQIESDLFKDSDLIEDHTEIYELLPFDDDEWKNPERYCKIYEKSKQPNSAQNQ